MNSYAIGVDIGGGHVSAALVNFKRGTLIPFCKYNTEIDNNAEAFTILEGWAEPIREAIKNIGRDNFRGIGFAMPGPFDYLNGIALFEKVAKYENLYGIDISKELRYRLNLRQETIICYMNDATAFGVGEAWKGAASKANKVVALTLGTGFGSAFIEDGVPVVEGGSVPPMGCFWHLPVKKGIADDYFSTRWFEKSWFELTGHKIIGVKPLTEIAENNYKARLLFEEYGKNMGTLIGPWLNRFGADCLVIGGNVSKAFGLFGPALKNGLKDQGIEINTVLSTLNEDAAIIGSARMIDPDYQNKILPVLSKM